MDDASLILSTAGSAIGTAQLLELFKHSKYGNWLLSPATSSNVKLAVGIIASGLVALGVHYEWNEATRVLSFTIPTLGDFLHHGWDWFCQWAIQQASYNTVVKGK